MKPALSRSNLKVVYSCGAALVMAHATYAEDLGRVDSDQTQETKRPEYSSMAVRASNYFGVDLFKQVSRQPGNIFLSPPSVAFSLAMIGTGAKDGSETRTEITQALHLPGGSKADPTALGGLSTLLNQSNDRITLQSDNHLWAQQGLRIHSEFQSTLLRAFHAEMTMLDFQSGNATETINRWVDERTKGKIPALFSGPLDRSTQLVVTNAIYFKGKWQNEFSKDQTKKMKFKISNEKTLQLPMMQQTAKFRLWESKGLRVLELPYDGRKISTYIILPSRDEGLQELEATFSPSDLDNWISATASRRNEPRDVQVFLPTFTVESQFDLAAALKELQIKNAWGPSADFSQVSGEKVRLSQVVHKTYIQVNEEGTEAAAGSGSVGASDGGNPVFRCDHPFLVVLRDNESRLILFLGRFSTPEARESASHK